MSLVKDFRTVVSHRHVLKFTSFNISLNTFLGVHGEYEREGQEIAKKL